MSFVAPSSLPNISASQNDSSHLSERNFAARPCTVSFHSSNLHLTCRTERCLSMCGVHRKHIRIRLFCGMHFAILQCIKSSTKPSQWTDYACSFINSHLSWRIPLFIQCIIGAILAGGSLFLPESPRWCLDSESDYDKYLPRSYPAGGLLTWVETRKDCL
jgi:hypothetical protein